MAESVGEKAAREYGTFRRHTLEGKLMFGFAIGGAVVVIGAALWGIGNMVEGLEYKTLVPPTLGGLVGAAAFGFGAYLFLKERHLGTNYDQALAGAPQDEKVKLQNLQYEYESGERK